ncbi:GWxTD domain-containing protein [Balneola sp. MJW-20]|uniref:GWxTD domain-containing protein n=1 Tax=Gracilimonas aurantiaca TaxID=3234185 RepID=UPI0034674ABF
MKKAIAFIIPLLIIALLLPGALNAQNEDPKPDISVIADSLNSLLSSIRSSPAPDPRLGIDFIKYVTETGISSQHERASEIYLWGLSGEKISDHKEILNDELLRLQPLLSDRQFSSFERKLNRDQPELLEDLRNFWKSMDPTPATSYNERLIEHWKRIAYSKKYFNKSNDTVFEADERAFTYVKYGQPDRIVRGVLQVSMGEMQSAARQLAVTDYGRQQAEFVAQQAFNYHENSPYEVWIYDELEEGFSNNVVRMFGEIPETGFGEVVVLEDLIPDRAFAISKRNVINNFRTSGFQVLYYNPGMILQWIYYNKFSTTDKYYADLFTDLDYEYTKMVSPTNIGSRDQSSALRFRSANEHQTRILLNEAPEEISTDKKVLDKIGADVYEYRFIDEGGRAYSRLIVESDPKRIFFEDLSLNQERMFGTETTVSAGSAADDDVLGWYRFSHELTVLDEKNNVIQRLENEPALVLDDSRYEEKTTSVFEIYPPGKDQRTLLTTSLINNHPASRPKENTSFDPAVRSYSTSGYDFREPLKTNRKDLIVSDLVLGFRDDSSAVGDLIFPFVVSNNREIFQGDNLFVHFEAYNLVQDSGGLYDLNVSYNIEGLSKGLFAEAGIDPLQVSLDFPADTPQIREDLEIESNRLVPGDYEMIITFRDLNSGNKIEKRIAFTVLYNN